MKRIRSRGTLSAYLLLAMSVLLVMVLGASGAALQSLKRSTREARAVSAFQAAQAGLEYAISKEFDDLKQPARKGKFVLTNYSITDQITPIAPNATGSVEVKPTSDPTKAWMTCTSTYEGMNKSVRTLLYARNVGIWNNAVFAGSGAAGQAINGNVDIRGSMHLLGEGEPYSDLNGNGRWDAAEAFTDSNGNGVWDPGEPFVDTNNDGVRNPAEPYNDTNSNGIYDPPLTQTDLDSSFGGNAYVGNNYSGMPAGLEAILPAAPRVNGIEQLGTEVRVKHGRISISGSATIGMSTDPDGGTSKGTIDGSYVNDGYTGNAGSTSVYSDNGTTNGYDLSALGISFPIVSGIGAQQYVDPGNTTWATQEAYLEGRSLTVPVTSITSSTAAFSYGPDAYGNSISYTPPAGGNNGIITVNGIVRFAGSLTIGTKNTTINYQGKGTLYARDSMSVHCNFLPKPGLIFPTNASVGLLTLRNLNLATGPGDSQLSMAGAFYAQGTIVSQKQNQIAGTFVANYFNMGTNVPNIYQVPELPYNMPPGMPGDMLYFSLKAKSWRGRQ